MHESEESKKIGVQFVVSLHHQALGHYRSVFKITRSIAGETKDLAKIE